MWLHYTYYGYTAGGDVRLHLTMWLYLLGLDTHLGYPAQAGMYDLCASHSVEPAALQSAIGLTPAQIGALSDAEPQNQLSTTPTTYQDLSQSTFIDPAELRAAIAASSSRA